MARSWTLGQQIAGGAAIPILAILTLGSFCYHGTQSLIQTSYWVAHTHEVLSEIAELLAGLKDAETGQRGYVITGREEYLESYRQTLDNIDRSAKRLRTLTTDSREHQRRLDTLQPLIQEKFQELDRTIELRRRDGFQAALRVIDEGRGKRAMDSIRDVLKEMSVAEDALLKVRGRDNELASRRLTNVLIFGVLAAILLKIAVALFIIRGLDRQIGTAVQHLLAASTELQAAATQQVKGAKGQASTVSELETTMRELVVTARQIAESAQRVTSISGETSGAARAGDHTVQSAQVAMDGVKRQVDRIVVHMLDLGRKSQEIGGILDIITELAEQTNILAINATIESAGAGESGRRFAVVADEIRKLADRVSGSTKDIRGLIEDIRAAANTTVMATEDGSKAVEASARQFSDVTQSFKRIAEYVVSTTSASREIELSTKQQTTAVEQVSAAITEVADTARETESSSSQTLQTATQLAGLSQQLTRLIRKETAG